MDARIHPRFGTAVVLVLHPGFRESAWPSRAELTVEAGAEKSLVDRGTQVPGASRYTIADRLLLVPVTGVRSGPG